MPNYKQMYLELFRATVRATNLLLEAQQKAEEEFLSAPKPPVYLTNKKQLPPKRE